jgi:hypothetical protein
MTGPSSSPRGEHPGTVPVTWEQHLVRNEQYADDDTAGPDMNQPLPPQPNRATRRALARAARKKNR